MMTRLAKISLVFAVALYHALVVLGNLTDYDSNYQFVRHVLMMDSTFPGNREMWRAINSPAVHTLFYLVIIAWECAVAVVCGWGALRMLKASHSNANGFRESKNMAILGLTLSLLLWFVAFLTTGGEWFLMWQSKVWNGQEEAFRMFAIVGIVLIFLVQPEGELSA